MQGQTTKPQDDQPLAPDPVQERTEKLLAIRALLRTAVPTRIEVLKRLPFDTVMLRHERGNRDLKRFMQSGMIGKSKRQTGEAFQAFVEVIASCAFAEKGVEICGEHFQDVHPLIKLAKQQKRVLSFEGLMGFLGALSGSRRDRDKKPVLVGGMPPELRDDVAEDVLARRRREFGTD